MTEQEYNRCVEAYSDNVYRFALKSLRSGDAAADIVQESFMRLWEHREDVIPGKEKSYLFTVAYRLIIDQVRQGKKWADGGASLSNHGSVQQSESQNDIMEFVARFLGKLPEQQRNLILLRDYEGYSYRELAEMTALSEAQVKIYLYRARVALKNSIGDIHYII